MLIARVLPSSELYKNQDIFISISEKITSLLVQKLANKCFEHRIITIIIEIK
jgi:hypothetical protein